MGCVSIAAGSEPTGRPRRLAALVRVSSFFLSFVIYGGFYGFPVSDLGCCFFADRNGPSVRVRRPGPASFY